MALLHPEDEYELVGLSLPSIQGDSVVAEWFASLGVTSRQTDRGVRVCRTSQTCAPARKFDMTDCPDLVPVMTALACLLPADFTFFHTQNLQYKESNRIKALHEQLLPFVEIFDIKEDNFRIKGKPKSDWLSLPHSFCTYHDHRLAMAFLLFGNDAILDDVKCLRKSYPGLISSL
jgi:3-phosphoshikimate 1-carboxyvinyltransferase